MFQVERPARMSGGIQLLQRVSAYNLSAHGLASAATGKRSVFPTDDNAGTLRTTDAPSNRRCRSITKTPGPAGRPRRNVSIKLVTDRHSSGPGRELQRLDAAHSMQHPLLMRSPSSNKGFDAAQVSATKWTCVGGVPCQSQSGGGTRPR